MLSQSSLLNTLSAVINSLSLSLSSTATHPSRNPAMTDPFLLPKLSRHTLLCIAATVAILITFPALWTFADYWPRRPPAIKSDRTFYDDPEVGYTIDKPVANWNERRRDWLAQNPELASRDGVLVVTGSQPGPCPNAAADHFLLRFFKNKVDYCRIHGHQIFYNNAFLQPEMRTYWAKGPVLRAAMVAHPEVEWLFWVDADAVFTDMDFRIPLERYRDHNLVVYGWPERIFEDRSWVSLNAGVFLLRNCQWSMDFLDVWASIGPKSPDHANWGKIMQSTLSDRTVPLADDQSAMVYLLVKGEKRWRDRTYVENEYYLSGYWLMIVDKYDDDVGKGVLMRRRRHAEAERERHAEAEAEGGQRPPFVTHFTGCAVCNGEPNPVFKEGSCRVGMERALNFADDQVLRYYGFVHRRINVSDVTPLRFDRQSRRRS